MSLINDAIKQANKKNKDKAAANRPPESNSDLSGLESTPGSGPTMPGRSGGMSSLFLIAGIVLFVLFGGLMLFLALRQSGEPQTAQNNVQPVVVEDNGAAEPTVPVSLPPEVSNQELEGVPIDATPQAAPTASVPDPAPATITQTVTSTPAPAQPTPQTPQEPVASTPQPIPSEPVELKLQGIYYRLNNPTVMINGKTLEIGDFLNDNIKVLKIERKEVIVEVNGEERTLRMN